MKRLKRPHPSEQFDSVLDSLRAKGIERPNPQFVAKLESRLRGLSSPKSPSMNAFSMFIQTKRPLVFIASGALAAVLIVVGVTHFRPTNPQQQFNKIVVDQSGIDKAFALKPTDSDALGVATTTAFVLTGANDVSCGDIAKSLTVSPRVDVEVKPQGSKECTVTPRVALAVGTVYRFALGSTVTTSTGDEQHLFQWAFQAKETLRVAGTLPHDRATGVPIDTGLEVTFNTRGVQKFEDHFTIAPATKGRFETHGRVIAFVPDERLKAGTLYTMTVTKGLGVKDSDVTLPDDVVVRFETAQDANEHIDFYSDFPMAFASFQPDEAPVLDFSGAYGVPGNVTATVYRFADAAELQARFKPFDDLPTWAYYSRQTFDVDVTGLAKTGEFPLVANDGVFAFPSGFDAGYYVIVMEVSGKKLETPLVVSELGASLTLTKTDSVLWVYDLKEKQPLKGAAVKLSVGDVTTTTDKDGVAQFATPEALVGTRRANGYDTDRAVSRAYIAVTAGDGRSTLVPAVPEQQGWGLRRTVGGLTVSLSDQWTYLWTDRSLYRPTDTVNIWGVAKQREDPKPQTVRFELWSWQYVDDGGNYIPVAEGDVTTNDYGSFAYSLPVHELKPAYYTLGMIIDGQVVANRSFEVKTFTKPAYQVAVSTDMTAGIDTENVTYTVTTQFFDGTPAPSIKLRYGPTVGDSGAPEVTTDENGKATVKERLVYTGGDNRYGVQTMSLYFFPVDAVEGDVAGSATVLIYPSAVSLVSDWKRDGASATVNVTTYKTDLTSTDAYWDDQFKLQRKDGTIAQNVRITGKVMEGISTKTKVGTYYDFVEKKVVDRYTYDYHEEERQTFEGRSDANGKFSQKLALTGDYYRVELTGYDDQDRAVTDSVSIYRQYYAYSSGGTGASFAVVDTNNQSGSADGSVLYKVGDKTALELRKNGEPVEEKGAFLFVKLQNGLQDATVTASSTLPFTFSDADAPNVNFTAVWFDGKGFRSPEGVWNTAQLNFDKSTRELTVTVAPTEKSYAPGDTATLAVSVKDAGGHGKRAMVNLSAIDEALATIQWDNPAMPLAALYSAVDAGLLQQYVSTRDLALESAAEGGGGGETPRKDFRDAPLFQEVETDGNGNARVEFKVPDNITSWRVTAQAVSKDLYAGATSAAVPVTKPLFGLLTMADEFVVADKPTVVGQAFGTALSASDSVDMKLEIPGLSFTKGESVKAYAGQRFALPTLVAGSYEMKLTVSANGKSDTLIRPFRVLTSRLARADSTYTDVTSGQTFTPASDERTELVFADRSRGRAIATFQQLAWAYGGQRIDRHLANRIAQDGLADLGIEGGRASSVPFATYQQDDGGIALLSYASSDVEISAFAASRYDLFDRTRLTNYFINELERQDATLDELGYALLGLAWMNEPVLPELDRFLELDGITDEHRLLAALGYAAFGANDKASALAGPLLTKYGEAQDPFLRLNLGKSEDAKIVNTGRFAILAEGLQLPERFGMSDYLASHFPKDTVTYVERALAVRASMAQLDATEGSFTYALGGKETSVQLKNGETKTLVLASDELKTLSITAVTGRIGVTEFFLRPVDVAQEKMDSRLSLTRTYSKADGSKGVLKTGDIVMVRLQPSASGTFDEGFFITDELPTGLVPLERYWERGIDFYQETGYAFEVNGQRSTFYSDGHRALRYYARVLIPGSYAADAALLQGERSRDILTYTSASQVVDIE